MDSRFTVTSEFLKSIPDDFWKHQLRFSDLCVEVGTTVLNDLSEKAEKDGDWHEANKAHGFVSFWQNKRIEAKKHIGESNGGTDSSKSIS